MRKVIILAFLMFVIIVAGCSPSAVDDEEPYVIRVGGGTSSPEHSLSKTWAFFKERLEEESDGRFQVELFISGELGGDRELTEAVQFGAIELTAPSTGAVTGFNQAFNIFDLPFLFSDREQTYEILDGENGQHVLETLDDKNLKGLAYFENGFRNLTNSVQPIESVDDVKNLSIRTMENSMHIEAWQSVGANPTPMSFEELYTALQQGTINGQENPMGLMNISRFYEVQDYLTLTNHIYSPYVVLMNKPFYDELPPDLQEVLQEVITEAQTYNRELATQEDVDALEVMKEQGVQVTELEQSELDRFQEAMTPIYEEYREMIGPDIYDAFLEETQSYSDDTVMEGEDK
ncbi:TRAP transporter substrate-binding protein [Oceanobacillus jeddahense]|uniref:TRAP transporter substrate-binding protein n=1 Tax=Oceanobacillus jeddahense TaxID=1462527 RepID=A0ABY5JRN5_9BACI|nr:TRAP transporter substrate-binding protein [Oceanobacillus jeddahense]UUI02961.1 TRAP transporter substrate-binding protein [Oceanobacillus jeddahense]